MTVPPNIFPEISFSAFLWLLATVWDSSRLPVCPSVCVRPVWTEGSGGGGGGGGGGGVLFAIVSHFPIRSGLRNDPKHLKPLVDNEINGAWTALYIKRHSKHSYVR